MRMSNISGYIINFSIQSLIIKYITNNLVIIHLLFINYLSIKS